MNCALVVLNPTSGPPYRHHDAKGVEQLFAARGMRARICEFTGIESIAPIVQQAADDGWQTVVAAGGDGTVSAVASVLARTDIAMGVLPLGTLNHFARDIGLPLDVEIAADVIAAGKTERMDVGEVNGRTFVNNSSIGIYPNIVVVRERERRRGHGKWLAFVRAIHATLRTSPFWTVRVEAQGRRIQRKTPFIFVGNNEYEIQGLQIGRRAAINGGRLYVYVAAPVSRAGLVWMALSALFGRLDTHRSLEMFGVEEAWIDTRHKHVRVSTDGEVSHMRSPLHYRLLKGTLNVIVP
jgi:YegS/Rv2252/BmrU family lipid kinase